MRNCRLINFVASNILIAAFTMWSGSFVSAGIAEQLPSDPPSKSISGNQQNLNTVPKMRSISIPNISIIKPVKGYQGNDLIHGEIAILPHNNKVIEGFIYINKKEKKYVYGEIYDDNTISAYDRQGHHYLLFFYE